MGAAPSSTPSVLPKKTSVEKKEILCHEVGRIVGEVAGFIRGELGQVDREQIEEKSLNSLVSYVDRQAEERLVQGLSALVPASVFLTEEATVAEAEGRYRWIIDPLDGTTNFLFGLPHFAVSVALQEDGVTQLGVVYEVNHKEHFFAWRGGGAYLNGRPIRCRTNAQLEAGLIATGFPYHVYPEIARYLQVFEHFMRNTRGVRRYGAAALDLAWTACGRYDGFFEKGLSPWDIAAGALLVEEAGGTITDFGGGDAYLFNGEVVAASRAYHPAMLGPVKAAFGR